MLQGCSQPDKATRAEFWCVFFRSNSEMVAFPSLPFKIHEKGGTGAPSEKNNPHWCWGFNTTWLRCITSRNMLLVTCHRGNWGGNWVFLQLLRSPKRVVSHAYRVVVIQLRPVEENKLQCPAKTADFRLAQVGHFYSGRLVRPKAGNLWLVDVGESRQQLRGFGAWIEPVGQNQWDPILG